MYADFDFYEDDFYGDMIPEDKFEKWESKAHETLDYITNDRIDTAILGAYETKIAKATCALAEVLYQIDLATKQANDKTLNGNVASRSSGGESISYSVTSTLISAVLADKKAQEKLMFDTVRPYLSGTGLLFQGV